MRFYLGTLLSTGAAPLKSMNKWTVLGYKQMDIIRDLKDLATCGGCERVLWTQWCSGKNHWN